MKPLYCRILFLDWRRLQLSKENNIPSAIQWETTLEATCDIRPEKFDILRFTYGVIA